MSVSNHPTVDDLSAAMETNRGIHVASIGATGEVGDRGGGLFALGHNHSDGLTLEAFNDERRARCQPLLLTAGERAAALRNLKVQYATVTTAGREFVLHRTDDPDTSGAFAIIYLADSAAEHAGGGEEGPVPQR